MVRILFRIFSGAGIAPRLFAAAWLLAVGAGAHAFANPSLTARLDQENVQLGETATLALSFTDCGRMDPPEAPEIENCDVAYSGSGNQFSFVNGVQSSSIVFRYAVRPKKEGDIVIPGFNVTVNGHKVSSDPLVLHVGKGFDISQLGRLKLIVPRTNVFVGETFPVEIRFYFRQSPAREEPPTLKLDGFAKGKQTAEAGRPEKINGQVHSVAKWTMTVTAVKAGDLVLGPAEIQTLYAFQARRQRGGPFDDPFFGQFFGGVEQRQIPFESDSVTLHVEPPPAKGRPRGYAGNVGNFAVSVEALTTNIVAGDPVTLRVRVAGRGDFDQFRLPDFPQDAGVTAYPPTSSFETADALGLEGVKTFEQVVTPENPAVTSLQFPTISWWNPDSGRYETSTPPAISLTVRPGAAKPAPTMLSGAALAAQSAPAPQPKAPASDLGRPKLELGALTTLGPAWVEQSWFPVAAATPPLAAIALVLAQRRAARPKDMEALRRAEAEKAAAAAAERLRGSLTGADAKAFFEALNDAMQRRLAVCTGGVPGAFTEDIINEKLVPRGLSPDAAEAAHRVFAAVAQARFSQTTDPGRMAALLADAENTLAALSRL
jgi:BatD DUF11 like domain